ncbi:hypothetical protein BDR04DRAFT_821438 [Suillus decipiens]|nr:hypothetical protein BDR04DRAFT_821438 [Suillus decipiens]
MDSQYSADEITLARNLQLLAYISISTVTFWTYDFACSFHEEWTFLLRSRWTKVKGLYIIARYVPFALIIMDLCLALVQNDNPKKCMLLSYISTAFGAISLIFSELFFILRTYALWNNNKILFVALLSTLFVFVVSSIILLLVAGGSSGATASAFPGIPGCYWGSKDVRFISPFVLMCGFQLGLVCLTMINILRSWRSAKGPLYVMLMKHNLFYYACGLVFSAVNIFLPILLLDEYPVYSSIEGLQNFILAILATRMHLRLWHTERDVNSSEALVCISMSDMSPANYTV